MSAQSSLLFLKSSWEVGKDLIVLVLYRRHRPCLQEGNPSSSRNLSLLFALPDPFVVQCTAGCVLYPNRTSLAFGYVGYNGQDFLSFDTKNFTWTLSQDTELSRYVQSFLQNYTALSELLETLFNDTCVDDMEVFLHYGRAALERKGETTLTLQQPAQRPPHWGPAVPHQDLPHPFALPPQSCLWPQSSPTPPA